MGKKIRVKIENKNNKNPEQPEPSGEVYAEQDTSDWADSKSEASDWIDSEPEASNQVIPGLDMEAGTQDEQGQDEIFVHKVKRVMDETVDTEADKGKKKDKHEGKPELFKGDAHHEEKPLKPFTGVKLQKDKSPETHKEEKPKKEKKHESQLGFDAVKAIDQLNREETASDIRRWRLKRARVVIVVCGIIFTILLSATVGAGLALWDMGKTPANLIDAIAGKGIDDVTVADSGNSLTFIDPSEESVSTDDEDDGLTFIDANEPSEIEESAEDTNSEDESDGQGLLDTEADAVTEAEDGTVIVSAELSKVPSIIKAGTDQVLTVVSGSQTLNANPNEGYPLPFQAVDESYFDDALFIGDSRFYGFMMWSGIPGANYCATSFNIFQYETFKVVQTGNGKVPIFNALPYNAFSKIYIKVGLNEMGSSEEKFEAKYAEIIARLREMEPRAIIYIHAVLPVTAHKSATDGTHNNPKIAARNASLKEFARQQQCYFIDAGPVLSDESGCLRPEMTGDGIHLSSRYMGVWKQYLMENAVVVP